MRRPIITQQNTLRFGGFQSPGAAVIENNIHTGCVSIASSFAFVQEGTVVTREDETIAPFPELDCPARHTLPVKPCTDFRQPDTCYDRTQPPQDPCIFFAGPGRPADIINDSHPLRGRNPEIHWPASEFPERLGVTKYAGGPFFSSAEPDYTSVKLLKFWQGGDGSYPYGPCRLFFDCITNTIYAAVLRLIPAGARSGEKDGLYGLAATVAPRPGFNRLKKTAANLFTDAVLVSPYASDRLLRQYLGLPVDTASVFPNENATSHFLHFISSAQKLRPFLRNFQIWQGVSGASTDGPGRLFLNFPRSYHTCCIFTFPASQNQPTKYLQLCLNHIK